MADLYMFESHGGCHNPFGQFHFVISPDGIYLIHFDHSAGVPMVVWSEIAKTASLFGSRKPNHWEIAER